MKEKRPRLVLARDREPEQFAEKRSLLEGRGFIPAVSL
jgi:hypothetical protein